MNQNKETESFFEYVKKQGFEVKIVNQLQDMIKELPEFSPDFILLSWNFKNLDVKRAYKFFETHSKAICVVFGEEYSAKTSSGIASGGFTHTLLPPLSGRAIALRLSGLLKEQEQKKQKEEKWQKKAEESKLKMAWAEAFDDEPKSSSAASIKLPEEDEELPDLNWDLEEDSDNAEEKIWKSQQDKPSIEEIKLKMAEAIDAIKNLNPTDEADFDKIFDFEKVEEGHFSDFLGANGIAHLYLNYGYSSPIFLILPTGTHPLNLEAKKLFSTHGTLLEFGRTGKSRVDISRNTIVIPMDFHSLGLGERERALISRLSRQNVSEFEILSSTRPEVKAFLTDPENSIPHSLRFLSFASDPGSSVDFRYRISFRTGKVDTLAPRIAKALDSILKIPLVSNSQWVAVGFRSKGGDWIMSLPTHISGEVSEPFSASYLEIRKDFYKSMGADLFLIVHGLRHFKPHMIEFLKKVAKSILQKHQ
jgi:hypothetical protein